MDRSRISTVTSLFTAALLASMFVLGGCSDSLTGVTPPDQDVTVQQNQTSSDGTSTTPTAGHNTSDED